MRGKLLKFFLVFILFISFIGLANANIIASHDFEDGTEGNCPNEWICINDTSAQFDISTTRPHNGTKSIKNTALGSQTASANLTSANITREADYLQIFFNVNTWTAGQSLRFWTFDEDRNFVVRCTLAYGGGARRIECFNGVSNTQIVTGLAFDTWFNFTFILDVPNQQYDCFLNDVLECNNFGFADSGTKGFNSLFLESDSSSVGISYIDDIFICDGNNCTVGAAPPSPVAVTTNRIEGITEFSQQGSVSIASSSYSDIIIGTFNITNITPAYASYTLNQFYTNNNPATIDCRILIDDQDFGSEVTRSNSGIGNYGSIRGSTTNFSLLQTGEHNATLQCKGSSPVSFDILNSNVLIHHLIDNQGLELNTIFNNVSESVNSVPFVLIKEINITTTTDNVTNSNTRSIIAEAGFNLDYSATGNISIQFVLGNSTANQTCSNINRYGAISTSGSTANFCVFKDAPKNQKVTLSIFASGNGDINGNVFLKEFITNNSEVQYISIPTELISSSSYVNITTLNLTSNTTLDLVGEASISSETHTGTTRMDYRYIIRTQNGTEIFRSVSSPNELGVAILQDAFLSLIKGDYKITLQGRTNLNDMHLDAADFLSYFAIDKPFFPDIFNVTLQNRLNNSGLINFTVRVNGVLFSDDNTGTATVSSNQATVNIIIEKAGFINETINNHNTDNNISAFISQPGIYEIDYTGFSQRNFINFTRNLTFTLNYTCLPDATVRLLINTIFNETISTTCDGTFNQVTNQYRHDTEEQFNTTFEFNTSFRPDLNDLNSSLNEWFSDLINPTLFNQTFVFETDFVNPSANLTMACNDTLIVDLNYTLQLNDQILFNNDLPNGTELRNQTSNLVNGANNATFTCADPFGNTSASIQNNIEIRTLLLLDELDNIAFNVSNLSSVIVYLDDNRTKFDFKLADTSNISFIATEDVKLRFEFISQEGTIIIRYVDIALLEDDIRVCVNKDDITHFEQLIISTTSKAVILKSVFADCIVAADFTRFAFEDVLALKAFTIQNLYKLFIFDEDGNQILLASVDGSIQTFINLDTIEFAQRPVTSNLVGDSLVIEQTSNTSVNIFYKNLDENNKLIDVLVTRLDTNGIVLIANNSDFVDINNFTILFNWAALPNVNDTTIFEIVVSGTRTDDAVFSITQFFNGAGRTGKMNSALAAILGFGLLFFGLMIGSSRQTFSWVGILFCIVSIIVLALGISVWYITFLQGIAFITMVILFIIMLGKNKPTIA